MRLLHLFNLQFTIEIKIEVHYVIVGVLAVPFC